MKMIVVALALVALATAGPVPDDVAAVGPVADTVADARPVPKTFAAAGPVPDAVADARPVPKTFAAAGPVPDAPVVPEIKILRSEFEPKEDGSYAFSFETENKIQRDETGELKPLVDDKNETHNVVVVRGSYSYINDLGEQEVINYWGDETGFHAEGPSVPRNAESASRR